MKKFLLPLLILVVGVGLARTYYMKKEVAERYTLSELQGIAEGASKNLPMMVDEITSFERVTAAEKLLEKRYKLISVEKSGLDIANFRDQMTTILVDQSCKNSQSLNLFNSGVSEWSSYYDKNDELIVTVKISSESCKN